MCVYVGVGVLFGEGLVKRAVILLCKLIEVVHKTEIGGAPTEDGDPTRPILRTSAEYNAAVKKLSLK